MATIEVTFPSDRPPGKILKWRVRSDTMVAAGRILLVYQDATPTVDDEETKEPEKKLRATNFGRVKQFLAKEGDVVQPGQVIVLLEGCTHPTVMIDLCAECGADLRVQETSKNGNTVGVSQASVPMVHSIPELKVCPELAEKIGKEDEQRLLTDRKLVLLVDLDQTIVHTTNDNIPPNLKDVFHFQLYGLNSPWYHTRLRPNTRHFLSEMSRLYELHICTFGARIYAHTVASLLDKDGILFSHRILSRDECFDPASKTANLKALFPCGDDLVCIIDDREDVWQGCGNLVQVKPYHFFRHTGDINALPGLEKAEILRLPEPVNANESYTNSQNKDSKNDASELSNEAEQPLNNPSVKETNHEDEKDEKTMDEMKNKNEKDEDDKVNTEKDAESNVQTSTAKEDDKKEIMKITPSVETNKNSKQAVPKQESNIIDDDDDDYLLYLEDILRRIHTEFYATLDQENTRKSLRDIIPRVRSQVLKGLCLTFSGLIPTHQKLHQSRAYKVARAFGAEVTQDLTEKTTHLVAIRKGTAKANAARKDTNIKIVNSDWLWTCAERWEHVDERLFPLTSQARGSRVPPPHCSSPERVEDVESDKTNSFANSINPLMSFTQEEIEFMDKEVNEDMEDMVFEDEEDDMEECGTKIRRRSSDSEDSVNDINELGVSKRKKRKLYNGNDKDFSKDIDYHDSEDDDNNDSDDDDLVAHFRRGGELPDLDLGDNSHDSVDDLEEEDNEDDREWNALGAALEREFLSE
ncbi:RNA polymerase II subunit A C-terminal domain phosphatase [Trachymyrmex septentrionalis]|uniref:RNA polymerase II subunit A C-terminal domain phosphatase n=1 Tax=Trachymyrmex septentrionalis TaxID=34720 RepID=A0A195EYG3_9HYME|nr:PREDICTED: RNA polymerase II subunit A C-terminal domain phosphatase [Trachymyrmex septentrionalis]KYN33258.1 RNA polymerase II subunit A C-terminal domain phosphatase [Trachymyrmex septentrionalis]